MPPSVTAQAGERIDHATRIWRRQELFSGKFQQIWLKIASILAVLFVKRVVALEHRYKLAHALNRSRKSLGKSGAFRFTPSSHESRGTA